MKARIGEYKETMKIIMENNQAIRKHQDYPSSLYTKILLTRNLGNLPLKPIISILTFTLQSNDDLFNSTTCTSRYSQQDLNYREYPLIVDDTRRMESSKKKVAESSSGGIRKTSRLNIVGEDEGMQHVGAMLGESSNYMRPSSISIFWGLF